MLNKPPYRDLVDGTRKFKQIKPWAFGFHTITTLKHPTCGSIFNYYETVLLKISALSGSPTHLEPC